MRWLLFAIAACSMGKDPVMKTPPPAPAVAPRPGPSMATLRGQVSFKVRRRVRAHGPEESFMVPTGSAVPFIVRSESAKVRTADDGSYALELPVGHHQVTFEDGSKNCGCARSQPRTFEVDIHPGANTLDWSCECREN